MYDHARAPVLVLIYPIEGPLCKQAYLITDCLKGEAYNDRIMISHVLFTVFSPSARYPVYPSGSTTISTRKRHPSVIQEPRIASAGIVLMRIV